MKVAFTLNYNEYLESQKSRLKNADRSLSLGLLAVMVGACGIALVIGILILQGLPDARRVAIKFLIVGALFLLATPVVWRWQKEKDVSSIEASIQVDFDALVKDKQRTFETEEVGWTFESEYGTDFRPWDTFAGYWKGERIFTLSSRSNVYVLPKRVFTSDQLASLEDQVEKTVASAAVNTIFSVRLSQSGMDYTLGAGSTHWQYRPTGILLLMGLFAVSAGLFWDQVRNAGQPGSDSLGLGLSIFCLALALWFSIGPLLQYGKYKDLAKTLPEFETTVTPNTICIRGADRKVILRYEHFRKFSETRGAFLFYNSDKTFVMLPKRGFDKKRLEEFREILKANIKPA